MTEHGFPTPTEYLKGFIASMEEEAAYAQEAINAGYTQIGRQLAKKESALARIAETRALIASIEAPNEEPTA